MRRLLLVVAAAVVGCLWAGALGAQGGDDVKQQVRKHRRSYDFLSKTYRVDRKYRSMEGPQSTEPVYLMKTEEPELLWIIGYEAVMKGPDGRAPAPQDFMCHSNLDYRPEKHLDHVRKGSYRNSRLFTLSQGQLSIEFPAGYGIPVMSSEPLSLTTQVLNHNIEGREIDVRHKVTVHFVRDRDLSARMKPLFSGSAYGLALVDGQKGYYGVDNPVKKQHGPGCLVGANASGHTYKDALGRGFTGHWVVKPGREINHTLVTRVMNLPYDTTLQYIAVHLHPFAESLELVDRTTGRSIFKSRARNYADRIGLEHVDFLSSDKGIPLYKDHEYEIVSVYNNTTGQAQDSMAVMYLYMLDKEFEKPRS